MNYSRYQQNITRAFLLLTLFLVFFLGGFFHFVFAEEIPPLGAWGWGAEGTSPETAGGAGWIDLSRVTKDNTGALSGYGWSSTFGWLKFGGLSDFPANDTYHCYGVGDCNASLKDGSLFGWARFMNGVGRTDGWDGWVSLRNTNPLTANYVTRLVDDELSGKTFLSGYLWGGLAGWIGINYTKDIIPTGNCSIVVEDDLDVDGNPRKVVSGENFQLIEGSVLPLLFTASDYTPVNSTGALTVKWRQQKRFPNATLHDPEEFGPVQNTEGETVSENYTQDLTDLYITDYLVFEGQNQIGQGFACPEFTISKASTQALPLPRVELLVSENGGNGKSKISIPALDILRGGKELSLEWVLYASSTFEAPITGQRILGCSISDVFPDTATFPKDANNKDEPNGEQNITSLFTTNPKSKTFVLSCNQLETTKKIFVEGETELQLISTTAVLEPPLTSSAAIRIVGDNKKEEF